MNSVLLRRIAAFSLIAAFLSVPAFAERRRSVAHPATSGPKFVVTITGTVVDDVTGLPVRNAIVNATFSGATDGNGKFRLRNVTAYGSVQVRVERTGYVTATKTLKINETPDLTFRMTPTQTVTVRRQNGTTVALDIESVRFGHSALFSGYVQINEVCKQDGSHMPLDISKMRRVTGPGTVVNSGPCCTDKVARIALTLKTNETFDIFFIDSCGDTNKPDFSGRDHVTGDFVYIAITDIAEIVFP